MKTIQFTDACATAVVELLATKWAEAATLAAVPQTSRIWDNPCGKTNPKERIAWQRAKASEAALLSKALWAFEIETPQVSTESYLTPIKEFYVKNCNAKKSDLNYNYHKRREYRDELVAAMLGKPKPEPKEAPEITLGRELLKAINTGIKTL